MFEFERVTSMDMLHHAWQKISAKKATPGIDGVDISLYRSDLKNNLRSLQTSITSGQYLPYREKTYNNRKNRQIYISCIDDKIVQTALAKIITSSYAPSKSVHGFITNRSVFTAKKRLDRAIDNGTTDFLKTDIQKFYESIDPVTLFRKVEMLIGDRKFLLLVEMLLDSHGSGISTGSCLSPALSNLYLSEFDYHVEDNSTFYSRYVDDILIAPSKSIVLINDSLENVGLSANMEKSKEVNTSEGFRYLGFDIKSQVDTAIQSGNFALAEKLHNQEEQSSTGESDVTGESVVAENEQPIQKPEPELPKHINAMVKKCHIVRSLLEKAKEHKYLGYPDKSQLLQLFHCLGEDGANFIHHVIGYCADYDYAETERRIKKYPNNNPIGCKKLVERYGNKEKCTCNFSSEKMYPSPVIHAKRVKSDCFSLTSIQYNIGHFKSKNPKARTEAALESLLVLNKKEYEIKEQQRIFTGQIKDLFERSNITELQTPQGLLVKSDDGIFIKVG